MTQTSNSSQGNSNESSPRRVVDVEVITPQEYRQGKRKGAQQKEPPRAANFSGAWVYSAPTAGCLPAVVTCALFLVCMAEYGLLAAIGFAVFHLVGNVLGSIRQTRQLMDGHIYNPWLWRTGNWLVSFLLTVWLAAGK